MSFDDVTAGIAAEMRRTAAIVRTEALLEEYRPLRERTEARLAQLRADRDQPRGTARAGFAPPLALVSIREGWWH